MIPTKKLTPHVPITPNEIIEQIHEAYELGITMVHLHGRDIDTEEPIDLIKRIHHIAEIFERRIMPPKKFGELGFYNLGRSVGLKKNDENLSHIGS